MIVTVYLKNIIMNILNKEIIMPRGNVNKDHIKLGSIIKRKRIEFGWSRYQLGDEIGVSHQQVQKYEKGTNRIDAIRLCQISKIFKCSLEDFYPDEIFTIERTRGSIEIIRIFNTLSTEIQNDVLSFMSTLNIINGKLNGKNVKTTS